MTGEWVADVSPASATPKRSTGDKIRLGRISPSLIAILAVYLLLAVGYGLATPILEAGDENWHEAVVWQIAAGHGLPVLNPAERHRVLVPVQEAGQPPLYYLLAAGLTFWVHSPDPAVTMLASPNAAIGQPDRSGWNKNLFVHTGAEAFPWRGLALAVHLQRLLSTLFGAVTIIAVYALTRPAIPRGTATAVLAAALVAFNPMFLFISAAVDNDALAIAWCTLILYLLARILRHGPTLRVATLTGVLLGLATLTKLSAAAIALPTVVVYTTLAIRDRTWRLAGTYLLALVLPGLLIAGWWFLRNWSLYGDPLGIDAFIAVAGGRPQPLTPQELAAEAPSLWDGFWGVFGIFDISLPAGYYRGAKALLTLAGLGLAFRLVARFLPRQAAISAGQAPDGAAAAEGAAVSPGITILDSRRPISAGILALLAGWLALEALLLVRWTAATEASSGRLLFPALGSVGMLVALGLSTLAGRWRGLLTAIPALLMAFGSALAIPLAILPAYAAPPFVPANTLHPAVSLGYRYGNLELVGATLPTGPLVPGGALNLTLNWTTVGPVAENDVVSVQLFGPEGERVENPQHRTDAFPGGGKILTSQWPAGMGIVDRIPILLRADIPQPSLVHIDVFVYPNGQQSRPLPVRSAGGNAVPTPEIGRLVYGRPVASAESPTPLAVFGGQIALDAVALPPTARAGSDLAVDLRWRALATPQSAYTVFIHIGPLSRLPLAQHDQQPLEGRLPTSDWVPGEVVNDRDVVPLPATLAAGDYDVYIGLYQAATSARLAATGGATQVRIGTLHVSAGGG